MDWIFIDYRLKSLFLNNYECLILNFELWILIGFYAGFKEALKPIILKIIKIKLAVAFKQRKRREQ